MLVIVAPNDPLAAADAATAASGPVPPATAAPPADPLTTRGDDPDASGGAASTSLVGHASFTQPAATSSDAHRRAFMVGQALFNQNWVAAPSNNRDHQGLGPLFNAQSCSSCHTQAGGGALPSVDDPQRPGFILRLSLPGEDAHGQPLDEPTYGRQLHPLAISGLTPDGEVVITYHERALRFGDGSQAELRVPSYGVADLGYGPLAANALLAPRLAPALIGLGLLDAVPEDALRAQAEAQRRRGDGISGHVNLVWDRRRQALVVGRFGWKAETATLEQQVAIALQADLGITTSLIPHENTTAAHVAALARPSGGEDGGPELSDLRLHRLTQWSHLLAVPKRRNRLDPTVLRGEALFGACHCDRCHTPTLTTGQSPGFPELAGQTIHPYTDLLVHDLGPDLADHRPEGTASGSEWRTAPLWGIGLSGMVAAEHTFLHDGRARSLTEAVLWHGGEATASRSSFLAAPAAERAALIAFLQSL